MTQQAAGFEDCDIRLESGRLRVRRWGAADAPAVLCVPGLSANLCGFDRLAERLAGDMLQLWDRYFTYELREVDGGVTPASDHGAVLEDLGYGNAMYWPDPDPPIHALWQAVTMPALVLRARQEIMPGFGFILPAAEAQRFAAAVPSARVAEIDANHYTITTHDDSIAAVGAFLRTS